MIRKAKITDVKAIQSLVNQFADSGQMLPRSLNELYECLRDFHVFEENGSLVGVCALHVSWDGLAEIRSLAVRRDRMKQGIGEDTVTDWLAYAGQLRVERVFGLAYQEGFSRKPEFIEVDKTDLPHKVW